MAGQAETVGEGRCGESGLAWARVVVGVRFWKYMGLQCPRVGGGFENKETVQKGPQGCGPKRA